MKFRTLSPRNEQLFGEVLAEVQRNMTNPSLQGRAHHGAGIDVTILHGEGEKRSELTFRCVVDPIGLAIEVEAEGQVIGTAMLPRGRFFTPQRVEALLRQAVGVYNPTYLWEIAVPMAAEDQRLFILVKAEENGRASGYKSYGFDNCSKAKWIKWDILSAMQEEGLLEEHEVFSPGYVKGSGDDLGEFQGCVYLITQQGLEALKKLGTDAVATKAPVTQQS